MEKMQGFTIVKNVTLPVLSLKDEGTAIQVKITSPIREGKLLESEKAKNPGDPQRAPAHLCHVTNLIDGAEMQMVVPKVLRSTLEEEYPEDAYVGKFFYIENLGKKKGGKSSEGYNTFKILEIVPDVKSAKK